MGRVSVALGCFLSAFALAALDWPFPSFSIGAGFGTQVSDRPIPGMTLRAEELPVKVGGPGDVAFVEDPGFGPIDLPSALGAFMAVHHDESFTALYAGLKPGTASVYLKKIAGGESLGMAGVSFYPDSAGAFFALFDRARRQFVNPLMFMPEIDDSKPPVIRSVLLRRGNDTVNLNSAKSIRQGEWQVFADILDETSGGSALSAPYRIRLLVNGNERAFFQHDVISEADGTWRLFQKNPTPFAQVYPGEGRTLLATVPVQRGRLQIQIVTADYAGNERSAAWVLNVE